MALVTPPATISFPNLYIPRLPPNAKPGATAVYGCTLLFTPEAMDSVEGKALQKAALDLIAEKVGAEKARLLIKDKKVKTGFRDDVESSGFPEIYKYFIRLKSNDKPGVVDFREDPLNRGKPAPINDPKVIYPGTLVRATVGLYWYDQDGNRGVGFGLRNIQRLSDDGERLDGRTKAENDFGFLEAAKSADDLLGIDGSNAQAESESLADLLG